MTQYSHNSQVLDLARDLIVDIRCARRDAKLCDKQRDREALEMYSDRCSRQLAFLYHSRSTVKFNQYGWPRGIWA